jgi:uncharacterized membrane protein YGL010W
MNKSPVWLLAYHEGNVTIILHFTSIPELIITALVKHDSYI